jgi:hypothetical protein
VFAVFFCSPFTILYPLLGLLLFHFLLINSLPFILSSFIHSSMAAQLFVGAWPPLQFRNLFYTGGRTPWTGDQPVARSLSKHRTTQTQNKRIYFLRGIRSHDLSVRASEDSSCLRPRGHCDRPLSSLLRTKFPKTSKA